ncbi:MAG: hypothetical protein JRF47_11260 [Deltaproteobacteria bacterium]|nr:hypothetical protein [Deltaproteobacteria bacterium]
MAAWLGRHGGRPYEPWCMIHERTAADPTVGPRAPQQPTARDQQPAARDQ